MTEKGKLRIGTSGIVLPGNKETFPATFHGKSRLINYASLLNTVEINSTFRKIPRATTFLRWAEETGPGFQFTLKLVKTVTHVKPLQPDLNALQSFIEAANHLGNKKACLLVQFPGSITSAYEQQVQQVMHNLHLADHEENWLKAVEFRSDTWYNDDLIDKLQQWKATLVLHDMLKSNNLHLHPSTSFCYFRFHGPTGDYRGSYSTTFLQGQAKKIAALLAEGKDVYVYFNNTMGNAFENAVQLRGLIDELYCV
ncbi:DUF72 domain-containing protein [Aridibaculum aurantiacum]|uniref:DUF72 domain-containing protein n=1 Tax=Aridibaculum aurantiacum TaxID=2810307 RepID=UPI001A96A4A0|nr:DUF72 domain-containing protein [Aridibaculum aurantiacum]